LEQVTISSNLGAGYGGAGLYNDGTVTLRDVTIENNTSEGGGGGFSNQNGGTAHLMNVTVSQNVSAFGGAGIDNDNNATITLDNVTVANNTAGYGGGGVYNRSNATITNTTISGNTAPGGAGIYNASGHAVTVSNTIVARNILSGTGNTGPDAFGSINSLGYNLIGQTDGSTGWNTYDLTGTASKPLDPKLSPLGNYGGPTQTMALLPGSPALNAGWSALAVDGNDNPLTTDQRGLPRIYGPSVDIGAYESQPPVLAGDVNHDGTVNLSDLLLLTRDFGKTTPIYEGGDLDGDGTVNLSDFLILTRNFGKTATPSTLPSAPAVWVPSSQPASGAITRRLTTRRSAAP